MQYVNFDVEFFDYTKEGGVEKVRVRAGSQTIAEAQRAVPVEIDAQLRRRVRSLEARGLTSVEEVVEVGRDLGDVLLPPDARRLLMEERSAASTRGARLRIRIRAIPELAALPWEYVYIADGDARAVSDDAFGFLALNREVSIVRLELNEQTRRDDLLEPVKGKLRVAVLTAEPAGYSGTPLDLAAEECAIRAALEHTPHDLIPRAHATRETLDEVLRSEQVHVFHFAGHGEFDPRTGQGSIVLEAAADAVRVAGETLAMNLQGVGVRLAVLDACSTAQEEGVRPWSGVARALLRARIPAVVGMQYKVQDESAIAFSTALYGALAQGESLDAAVSHARLAVYALWQAKKSPWERDWGVPVTYLRGNTESTVLFPSAGAQSPVERWKQLSERAMTQPDEFADIADGRETYAARFLQKLYVRRAELEAALARLLAEDAPALILLGQSGAGKTTLLCQWALDAREAGHVVFTHHVGNFADAAVEQVITKDLAFESEGFETAMKRAEEASRHAGKRTILVFDALNDFRGRQQTSGELLKRLVTVIRDLPRPTSLRIVIACNTVAWDLMQRHEPALLPRKCFVANPAPDGALTTAVGRFTEAELDEAYRLYSEEYKLTVARKELPEVVQKQIAVPYLLRLLAESRPGRAKSELEQGILVAYARRKLFRLDDQDFLRHLVRLMLDRGAALVRTDVMKSDADLGRHMRDDDKTSPWCSMLSEGVLYERAVDGQFSNLAGFSLPGVGAYVIAQDSSREKVSAASLAALLAKAERLPMAWDAARMLLLRAEPADELDMMTALATSKNPEHRELVVSVLVDRYDSDARRAKQRIRDLLCLKSLEAQRTALKAAYCIGAEARDIFLEAAESGDVALRAAVKDTLYLVWRNETPSARRAAADTLYLIWRRSPGFTKEFLKDLLGRISVLSYLRDKQRAMLFVELSIMIYINHCEKPEVVEQTADLYGLLAERLHLGKYRAALGLKRKMAKGASRLLHRKTDGQEVSDEQWPGDFSSWLTELLTTAMVGPILDAVFPVGLLTADSFFTIPKEKRAAIRQIVPYIDPQTDLRDGRRSLEALLDSRHQLFNVAGAMAIAIHLTDNCDRTAPLVRDLFENGGAQRRHWLLFSMCLLIPGTPREWQPLAEELTERFLSEHQEEFYDRKSRVLKVLDFAFMPIGLACGKAGEELTFVGTLLKNHAAAGDTARLIRCIDALTPVAFYYPEPVLAVLEESLSPADLKEESVWRSLRQLLATTRTLHIDLVDAFLARIGVSEERQSLVGATTDDDLLHHYITSFGYFNNAVHQSLRYPWMRKELAQGGLAMLSDAPTMPKFKAKYAQVAQKMFFDADFDLRVWTTATADGPTARV
jgi:hypothetical protein